MGTTSIEWTDKTWNPITGCTKVSTGCSHCYALRMAGRFCQPGEPFHGIAETVRGPDRVMRRDHRSGSVTLTKVEGKARPRWTGAVAFHEDRLEQPFRWRKPARVFVNSMGDLFHENVTNEMLDRVWAVMLLSGRHTFQILTKRPQRMLDYLRAPGRYDRVIDAASRFRRERRGLLGIAISNPATFPAPWIWLGVSAENQAAADERVPLLLKAPAVVRFVSCEPLFGQINFRGNLRVMVDKPGIDWVIAGCETGPGARPMSLDWARSLRDQCADAGVPYFLKRLTARGPSMPALDGRVCDEMPRLIDPLAIVRSQVGSKP
jgi:protein gp37